MPTSTFSTGQSLLISGFISGLYVGGLYVARSARLSFVNTSQQQVGERSRQPNERWRDDDDVIRTRLKAAMLSTCASCGIVYLCVVSKCSGGNRWHEALGETLRLLGLKLSISSLKSILPHLLILSMYTGPLTTEFLSGTLPFQRHWSYQEKLRPIFATWIGLRNLIVAPITEELVFRACLLAVAELSGQGLYQKLFATPLWFGVAHLHHAYDIYNRFGRTRPALTRAIIACLVQMSYTTLFGAYTSFLLLRTGSVFPAITAHFMANVMGIPQLRWELRQHPKHRLLICTAYLVGIVGFAAALGPWTA